MLCDGDALLRRCGLAELSLERLVGLPRKVGVEFAELGRLRDKRLVRALGVVALHLDRLIEGFRTEEFLGRGGALLEHLLRVVRDLDRDRLQALGKGAERPQRRIHVVLTQLLHLVDPNHVKPFRQPRRLRVTSRVSSQSSRIGSDILRCTKKSRGLFALQYGSTVRGLTVSQSGSRRIFGCRPGGRPSAVWLENQKQEEAKKVGKTSENRPF